jgi:hypothetical protein
MASLHLSNDIRFFQNRDVNLESRSDTITLGIPKAQIYLSKNMLAIYWALYVAHIGMNIQYLLNRSTIENMLSNPLLRGKCVIKSILIWSKHLTGTGKG